VRLFLINSYVTVNFPETVLQEFYNLSLFQTSRDNLEDKSFQLSRHTRDQISDCGM